MKSINFLIDYIKKPAVFLSLAGCIGLTFLFCWHQTTLGFDQTIILFNCLLFIIAMFLVFYIATSAYAKKTKTKPIFSLFTIVSPSMEPNIMVYDVIFDKKVNNNDELM
jgi:signal peptidase I